MFCSTTPKLKVSHVDTKTLKKNLHKWQVIPCDSSLERSYTGIYDPNIKECCEIPILRSEKIKCIPSSFKDLGTYNEEPYDISKPNGDKLFVANVCIGKKLYKCFGSWDSWIPATKGKGVDQQNISQSFGSSTTFVSSLEAATAYSHAPFMYDKKHVVLDEDHGPYRLYDVKSEEDKVIIKVNGKEEEFSLSSHVSRATILPSGVEVSILSGQHYTIDGITFQNKKPGAPEPVIIEFETIRSIKLVYIAHKQNMKILQKKIEQECINEAIQNKSSSMQIQMETEEKEKLNKEYIRYLYKNDPDFVSAFRADRLFKAVFGLGVNLSEQISLLFKLKDEFRNMNSKEMLMRTENIISEAYTGDERILPDGNVKYINNNFGRMCQFLNEDDRTSIRISYSSNLQPIVTVPNDISNVLFKNKKIYYLLPKDSGVPLPREFDTGTGFGSQPRFITRRVDIPSLKGRKEKHFGDNDDNESKVIERINTWFKNIGRKSNITSLADIPGIFAEHVDIVNIPIDVNTENVISNDSIKECIMNADQLLIEVLYDDKSYLLKNYAKIRGNNEVYQNSEIIPDDDNFISNMETCLVEGEKINQGNDLIIKNHKLKDIYSPLDTVGFQNSEEDRRPCILEDDMCTYGPGKDDLHRISADTKVDAAALDIIMGICNVDGWIAPRLPSIWHMMDFDVVKGYLEEELVIAIPRASLKATRYWVSGDWEDIDGTKSVCNLEDSRVNEKNEIFRIIAETECYDHKSCNDSRKILVHWKEFNDPKDYTWEKLGTWYESEYGKYYQSMLYYSAVVKENQICVCNFLKKYIEKYYNIAAKKSIQNTIKLWQKDEHSINGFKILIFYQLKNDLISIVNSSHIQNSEKKKSNAIYSVEYFLALFCILYKHSDTFKINLMIEDPILGKKNASQVIVQALVTLKDEIEIKKLTANCSKNIEEVHIDPQEAKKTESECKPIMIVDAITNKTIDRVQIVKSASQTYLSQNPDQVIVNIDSTDFKLPPLKSSELKDYFKKLQSNFKSKSPTVILLPIGRSQKKNDPYYDQFYSCIYEYLVSFNKFLIVKILTSDPTLSAEQKDKHFQIWKQKYETEYESIDDDTNYRQIPAWNTTIEIHDHSEKDDVKDDKSIIYFDSDDEMSRVDANRLMSHKHVENIENDTSIMYGITSDCEIPDNAAENVKDDITIIYEI